MGLTWRVLTDYINTLSYIKLKKTISCLWTVSNSSDQSPSPSCRAFQLQSIPFVSSSGSLVDGGAMRKSESRGQAHEVSKGREVSANDCTAGHLCDILTIYMSSAHVLRTCLRLNLKY